MAGSEVPTDTVAAGAAGGAIPEGVDTTEEGAVGVVVTRTGPPEIGRLAVVGVMVPGTGPPETGTPVVTTPLAVAEGAVDDMMQGTIPIRFDW